MTEYDYSPEAYEKYLVTQHRIARWVDDTNRSPLKNPFTPATPAVHNSDLPTLNDEAGSLRRRSSSKRSAEYHRKQQSKSYTRPPSPNPSKKPVSSRQRSMSYSNPIPRPSPSRSQTAPQRGVYYPEPISRDHSGHSSQTSSSTQPFSASTAYLPPSSSSRPNSSSTMRSYSYPFPHQQYPDYGTVRPKEPLRSNTAPAHVPPFSIDQTHYSHPTLSFPYQSEKCSAYAHQPKTGPVLVPLPNGSHTYIQAPLSQNIDISKIPQQPQLPFSVYERPKKQLPLLKRLFTGFGGKDHSRSQSSGIRTPEPSPTKSKLRRRRSSFNL